ncbi:VpsF family polysaccharide biosynthesis protein [Rhodopseudomonas sp. P2A-2r]|uniref:VpsF family polysaccharide biosynthesis protein n=1 Tax=unclassified Rhodopseudomonas TaxID=2638247 RepID=UPI00223465AB|nr:VpsF family polysaccharide biosynthesis protein [Rhodopseudomonas sp. P2A-2r]UZE47491.1 VpsF family polysaccharide biosynthesis protein [Rhodopseudomonas sp. P2A-2r]
MVTALMLLAAVSMFAMSSAMLTNWKIHYLTNGGGFYEKLHPATYAVVLASLLLLVRNGDPVGEINRTLSQSRLVLVYLFSWLALLVQMFVLERPFTIIIDTFLLPVILCLVIWRISDRQKRLLVWAIHATILLNVALGYYEYFSGHRLIPLTLGSVVVLGEWRASAFLGHPLTASGVVAAYVLALVLRPALCRPIALRLPLITVSLGSLMAFGGRTALMTVLAVLGCLALIEIFKLLRGKRTSLLGAIAALCLLFVAVAGIFAALNLGIFDKMLLRFSSDKGSTLARYATFNLLSHFDWHELILGPSPVRVNALQSQLGLNYGIENFWVSSTVQFGIVHTALLTVGLVCFFVEILKRSGTAAWAIVLLILMIAASSVSFSSKNIQLAQFIALITLLLPNGARSGAAAADSRPRAGQRHIPA